MVEEVFSRDEMQLALRAADELLYGSTFEEWAKRWDAGESPPFQRARVKFPTGTPALDGLVACEYLLDLLEACLGTEASFGNAHAFVRNGQAEHGAAALVGAQWHIDHDTDSYLPPHSGWRSYGYVNCHIYLDSVTIQQAPMQLIPGSHEVVARKFAALSREGTIDTRGNVAAISALGDIGVPVSATGSQGAALLYSSYLLHRAVPFQDARAQRSLFGFTLVGRENRLWKRSSWPYTFVDRSLANQFCASTSSRMRTVLGWPAPGHPYYTIETLAALAKWYPGIELGDYYRCLHAE